MLYTHVKLRNVIWSDFPYVHLLHCSDQIRMLHVYLQNNTAYFYMFFCRTLQQIFIWEIRSDDIFKLDMCVEQIIKELHKIIAYVFQMFT